MLNEPQEYHCEVEAGGYGVGTQVTGLPLSFNSAQFLSQEKILSMPAMYRLQYI